MRSMLLDGSLVDGRERAKGTWKEMIKGAADERWEVRNEIMFLEEMRKGEE